MFFLYSEPHNYQNRINIQLRKWVCSLWHANPCNKPLLFIRVDLQWAQYVNCKFEEILMILSINHMGANSMMKCGLKLTLTWPSKQVFHPVVTIQQVIIRTWFSICKPKSRSMNHNKLWSHRRLSHKQVKFIQLTSNNPQYDIE